MEEMLIREIFDFINQCDKDLTNGIHNIPNIRTARLYLKAIQDKKFKCATFSVLTEKLEVIIKRILDCSWETLNFIGGASSLTEYVIYLIKEKHLTDPKLIARCAYIELSKYLYYDISYTKASDPYVKRIIVDTPVNPKSTKMFSYVVCTQWLQLYKYILSRFEIHVKDMRKPSEDHVWGEIELNNKETIIVDATAYLGSSIDLSNAKSLSNTVGFLVVPPKYSGISLQDIYNNPRFKSTLDEIQMYYQQNRELDISLGYISSMLYPVEILLSENELFKRQNEIIGSEKKASEFMNKVSKFLSSLSVPNNMDGYEIFAYYHMFIERLPINIRGNISMKTLYVDNFAYKQARLRRMYLQADEEYLKYLNDLVYSRYYSYLDRRLTPNELFSLVKEGVISNEELSKEILKRELAIAEISKRLIPFYAVNELVVYNPFSDKAQDLYQLYEPSVGKKSFRSLEEEQDYKKRTRIL